MDLQGRTALITGGAHRVGKAITLALAQAGANVVVNYNRSADAAQQTVAEAKTLGVDALAVQCDVSDLDAVRRMIAQVEKHFGRLDVLVNGADYFGKHPFPLEREEDLDTWRRIIDITVHGSFYVSNACAPLLLAQKEAAIVNIVDLSAWQPWPNFTAHAVAKSGLLALTRQMALELAPTVRVNAVAPGPVLPPPDYDAAQKERVARRTLLKRWGSAEDVGQAVCFLAQADYITGDVIFVDGGEHFGAQAGA